MVAGCASPGDPGSGASREPLPPIATDPCPASTSAARVDEGLPDVALPCLGHDGDVRLAGLRGRPLVVNLWASWCVPCKKEMPAFQRVHGRLGDRVQILGVASKDFERPARGTIQSTGVSYPSVLDQKGDVRARLSAVGLPATFFVAPDGRIVGRHLGELTETEILDAIGRYLGVR